MEIENLRAEVVTYHALAGQFDRVFYFATSITLEDAAENLMLFPQEDLSFRERIQRVLNEERVTNEILPYLRTDPLRFFNSIVCVLLPARDSDSEFWEFAPYTTKDGKEIGKLGELRISKSVFRIVLDGQHRFRALQEFWKEERKNLIKRGGPIDIPVVFIAIDQAGKKGKKVRSAKKNTLDAVRRIFSVINKTAKPVDKNTLLLIDDSDLTNIIARRLLEEEVVAEDVVKWIVGDTLRSEDSFFTTIQTLRDFVRSFLGEYDHMIKHIGDTSDKIRDLMNEYYYNPKVGPVAVKNLVETTFAKLSAYKDWEVFLAKRGIARVPQPKVADITAVQVRQIEGERRRELAFTVAGQRTMFRAIAFLYLSGTKRSSAGLANIVERFNSLYAEGLFTRKRNKRGPENPFFGVLFDDAGRMIWATPSVDLGRRILSIAMGGNLDRVEVKNTFHTMTTRDSCVLDAYWDRATAVIG
jgi:DGQHR domain-containing protein